MKIKDIRDLEAGKLYVISDWYESGVVGLCLKKYIKYTATVVDFLLLFGPIKNRHSCVSIDQYTWDMWKIEAHDTL